MEKETKPSQIDIKADAAIAQGAYCNLAQIAHTAEEFLLDFMFIIPNSQMGMLRSRIIMSPEHAKRLQLALGQQIAKYEQSFGEIKAHPLPLPATKIVH